MSVLEDLVDLHRPGHLQLLSISGWGVVLVYCGVEWFALETSRDHSVIFEIAPKHYILDSLIDLRGLLHFF